MLALANWHAWCAFCKVDWEIDNRVLDRPAFSRLNSAIFSCWLNSREFRTRRRLSTVQRWFDSCTTAARRAPAFSSWSSKPKEPAWLGSSVSVSLSNGLGRIFSFFFLPGLTRKSSSSPSLAVTLGRLRRSSVSALMASFSPRLRVSLASRLSASVCRVRAELSSS